MADKLYTYKGLSLKINPEKFESVEFVEGYTAMLKLSKKKGDPAENSIKSQELVDFMLGDEKDRIYAELKKRDSLEILPWKNVADFVFGIVQEHENSKK